MIFKSLFFIVAITALTACNNDKTVRQYNVSAQDAQTEKESVRAHSGASFQWQAPSSWRYRTPQNPMQLAIFVAPEKTDTFVENPHTIATVSISFLKGEAGSLKNNVRRWQKQLGLEKSTNSTDNIRLIETSLGSIHIIKLNNKEKNDAILAAVYKKLDGTLFVKIRGPLKTIEQQTQAFIQFIETIQEKKVSSL